MTGAPRSAVLLAGGAGSRVAHIAPGIPKPLLQVDPHTTVIDLSLAQLRQLGVSEVIVAGGPNNEAIASYLDSRRLQMRFRFLSESGAGTQVALKENINRLPRRFWVANADTILLERPAGATCIRSSGSFLGAGRSAGASSGNLVIDSKHAIGYDKAGGISDYSDCGYHILDLGQTARPLRGATRSLEDGMLQEATSDRWELWSRGVEYLDLGTESSLLATREALQDLGSSAARMLTPYSPDVVLNFLQSRRTSVQSI